MRLFISWSGSFSQEIAEKLRSWIPVVLQKVQVFYSKDDIEKGENWNTRLSAELSSSDYGLVCLTPQNASAPWIHYESGALSKVLESRLTCLMIGITPSEIKGPLSRFQNTFFNREDFFKLLNSINSHLESPIEDSVLSLAFNMSWPLISNDIEEIIRKHTDNKLETAQKTSEIKAISHEFNNNVLEEILSLVRKIDNNSFNNNNNLVDSEIKKIHRELVNLRKDVNLLTQFVKVNMEPKYYFDAVKIEDIKPIEDVTPKYKLICDTDINKEIIMQILHISDAKAQKILDNYPYTLATDLTLDSAKQIQALFDDYNVKVRIIGHMQKTKI